ncbi:hypothetical protein GCM10009554_28220 [Kribbella koreensis]|uniref:Uncharacterized protein n=2 Tax=Kribbella TaxID=182639 RepID=A0ABP6YMP2_9ACTN
MSKQNRISRRFVLSAVALAVVGGSVGLTQPVTAAPAPEASTSAYIYPVLPGTDAWKKLATHDDMLRVTQVPATALAGMSTAALVDTVLRYPLYDDMLAFDDLQKGFEKMSAGFDGFSALAARPDAGAALLQRYESMSPAIAEKSTLLEQGQADASFRRIETLLTQSSIRKTMTASQLSRLATVGQSKQLGKQARADVYGKASSSLIFTPTDNNTTIYTPRGSAVAAINMTTELTSAQITSNNNYVASNYPNATRLRNSSRRYNCHSYAWYDQGTGNTKWINSPGDDKFWTDGSYIPNSNVGQGGRKVSYRNDDHSAITVNATVFDSKWGQLPLMRHNYNYTPYNSSALYYYSRA